jgi:hypothetical protein
VSLSNKESQSGPWYLVASITKIKPQPGGLGEKCEKPKKKVEDGTLSAKFVAVGRSFSKVLPNFRRSEHDELHGESCFNVSLSPQDS